MPKETISDILANFSTYIDQIGLPNVLNGNHEDDLLSKALCAGWILGSDAQYSVINFLRLELLRSVSNEEYNKVMLDIEDQQYSSTQHVIKKQINELLYKMQLADLKTQVLSGDFSDDQKVDFINQLFKRELYPEETSVIIQKAKDIVENNLKKGVIEKSLGDQILEGLESINKMTDSSLPGLDVLKMGESLLDSLLKKETESNKYDYYCSDAILNSDIESDNKLIQEIQGEQVVKNRAKRLIREMGGIRQVLVLVEQAEKKGDKYIITCQNQRVHKDDVVLALEELLKFGLNNPLKISENELRYEAENIKKGLIESEKKQSLDEFSYEGLVCIQCKETKTVYRYSLDDLMFMIDLFYCDKHKNIMPENSLVV